MKILDDGKTLECNSTPDNWNAEKMSVLTEGSKRNTYRFVDPTEHCELVIAKKRGLRDIRVVNTVSGESFLRKLTDMRPFEFDDGKLLWIFSW